MNRCLAEPGPHRDKLRHTGRGLLTMHDDVTDPIARKVARQLGSAGDAIAPPGTARRGCVGASGPGIEGPAQAEQPAVRGTQDQDDLDPRSRHSLSDPPPLSDSQRTARAHAPPSTTIALESPCFPHSRSGGYLDHHPRLQSLSRYTGLSPVDRAIDRRIILRGHRGR